MTATSKTLARITGLLVGCLACGALVLSDRVPAREGTAAARLVMRSDSTGALGVRPAGRFISSRMLLPGAALEGARGTLAVASRSAVAMSVRLRAVPASADLDTLLVTELRIGGERIFRGRLGELRRWTRRSFRLLPGETKRLYIRAWLPRSVRNGYESRLADVTLVWQVGAA